MKQVMRPKIAALAVALVTVSGLGINTRAQDPKPAAKEPSYKYVELLNSDTSRFKFGDESIYILKGNVKMKQGDTTLVADNVEYNRNDKVQIATATGNMKISDPQNDITGTKGTTYFKEKRAVVDGNVKIVAKPKAGQAKTAESPKGKWKDPVTITCDNLEYLYKSKIANLKGNLRFVQKNRVLTATSAVYLVKEEKLTLIGNVQGKDEKNQEFSAPGEVVVSLKDGDEWIEMKNATGKFRVEIEEDEEEAQPAKPAGKPAQEEPRKQ